MKGRGAAVEVANVEYFDISHRYIESFFPDELVNI